MLLENVTLADLVADERLSNPKRYLRKALGNMLLVGEFGKVSLRIGRSGNGIWPHYVLEEVQSGDQLGRYDGQTHKVWSGEPEHHEERWSDVTMLGDAIHRLWHNITLNA